MTSDGKLAAELLVVRNNHPIGVFSAEAVGQSRLELTAKPHEQYPDVLADLRFLESGDRLVLQDLTHEPPLIGSTRVVACLTPRTIEVDYPTEILAMGARRHHRRSCTVAASVVVVADSIVNDEAVVLDVSLSGASIRFHQPAVAGEHLLLGVELDGRPLLLIAEVVGVDPHDTRIKRCTFTQATRADEDAIAGFVNQRGTAP
jgi:hypothetical protein